MELWELELYFIHHPPEDLKKRKEKDSARSKSTTRKGRSGREKILTPFDIQIGLKNGDFITGQSDSITSVLFWSVYCNQDKPHQAKRFKSREATRQQPRSQTASRTRRHNRSHVQQKQAWKRNESNKRARFRCRSFRRSASVRVTGGKRQQHQRTPTHR